MPEALTLLASFTAPMNIGMTPASMLWMFPLLLSITIIYKATKLRVLFWKQFVRDVAVLFVTISLFMIFLGVVLNIVVWFFTS